MKNLFFIFFAFLFCISLKGFSQDGKFTFSLPSTLNTSAGVFKNDSILIKTLWNNVSYKAGTYTKSWDGTDDFGNVIQSPDASYKIKVLSNNVQYTWQGSIGNSSDAMTGETKHNGGYHCMMGLVFSGSYGYFCTGYSEGRPSISKFNISTPNQKINFADDDGNADNNYVATDDNYVYWGAFDSNFPNNTFVHATKVSDDSPVKFSWGVNFTPQFGKTYSTIAYNNSANTLISGLAVQKRGNYLFVARKDMNRLQVLNKATGELIQTLSVTNPKSLCVDASDNLWMVTGTNTVSKYTVNANGTLSGATLTLAGLVEPLALRVSTDGNLISVADGGSSQQIKFYNNITGALTSVLGDAGGYNSDATVTDSKFYLSDVNHNTIGQYGNMPFVAYQADGSFWVNDPGNYRVQHYNSNGSYVNRIMNLGANYTTFADKNNINKVFNEFLEFEIDYSVQTLSGTQGWRLKKNWGATVDAKIYNGPPRFETTLSNGRTYGFIRNVHDWEVVEFPSSGQLRFTGIKFYGLGKILCNDGSLQDCNVTGNTTTIKRYALTGFDGMNNPQWSSTAELLVTVDADVNTGNSIAPPNNQAFSSRDKIVFFNTNPYIANTTTLSSGYHVGVLHKGANNVYQFQTEKSTHRNYSGDYPPAGYFDIGNRVNTYAGGSVNILDRNIITSYHGEFWKNSQTNMFNHYYDDGLAIGQFGTTGPDMTEKSAAMMAGNALTPVLVKDANGDLYLYHGDEGHHAGFHRWKITGLNTVKEQVINIAFPSASSNNNSGYTDLMAGLPYDAVLSDNTAGWKRNPAYNNESDPFKTLWRANTSRISYGKNDMDISIESLNPTGSTWSVSRDLGVNTVTSDWKITGNIAYDGDNNPNTAISQQYLEVLDASGKILAQFYPVGNYGGSTYLYGNKSVIATAPGHAIQMALRKTTPIEIKIENGTVTITYGNYAPVSTTISDPTGNWKAPKTLQVRYTGDGTGGYTQMIAIQNFKFYKDVANAAIAPVNQAPIANAGGDINVTLPAVTANLGGAGTDADGTISNYSWIKISGPSATIASANAAYTQLNNLVQGIYQFELTVTDNNGATGKDTVHVTVNPATAGNLLPAVNPVNPVNGLDYKYYEGNWNMLPDFSALSPIKAGTSSNFDLSLANRADQYGFSFTGYINVPADGQYTFYTASDDGSSLYIDNVLTVSNDGLHSAEEKSGTIGLKAGKHVITGLFFQQGGGQVFTVSYEGMGITKQAIPSSALFRASSSISVINPANGLDYKYYEGNWTMLPNFSALNPIKTGTTSDFNLSLANRPDQYGFSFTGYINIPSDGQYTFYTTSDDGSSLYIDNVLTVSNDGLHGAEEKSGSIWLKAGNHPITGLFFQQSGGQVFIVSYEGMGITKQPIPSSVLFITSNNTITDNLLPAVYPSNAVNGLDYKYYEGSWTALPNFSSLYPIKTGTSSNFDLSLANRPDLNGFNFTGYINVPVDGQYTFYTSSDDGSNLYIDNVLTVANDGLHGAEEKSGTIGLKAGKHAISGLFFQQGGGQVFVVSYASADAGIAKRRIPASALYRVNISGRSASPASKETSPKLGNAVNPIFATANGISVFPNPVKDVVNIEINAKDKNDHLSISVYNSVGVLVKNIQLSTNQATTLHQLNLSGLANGYYSIVVRFNDGQQLNSRIVKVKE